VAEDVPYTALKTGRHVATVVLVLVRFSIFILLDWAINLRERRNLVRIGIHDFAAALANARTVASVHTRITPRRDQ
jgi:hypothetical protein